MHATKIKNKKHINEKDNPDSQYTLRYTVPKQTIQTILKAITYEVRTTQLLHQYITYKFSIYDQHHSLDNNTTPALFTTDMYVV